MKRNTRGERPSGCPSQDTVDGEMEKLRLKRDIGFFSTGCLIAGSMVGSGIFMSPQGVLFYMGSIGGSLSIWATCGFVSTLGALCYAELGTSIKESGNDYIYLLRIYGQFPSFLCIYLNVFLLIPASNAAIALSFSQYVANPFYQNCSSPETVVKLIAILCILVVVTINCFDVTVATRVINTFTVTKFIALLVIIVGGMVMLVNGHTGHFQNAFQGTATGYGAIGIAFYQGLWPYDGWSSANYVTEELKRPEVNLPRALMIAVPLVTCLYIMVNISYFTIMSTAEMLASGAVAVSWGSRVLGSWMWLMPLSVAMSTFGCINGGFFSGGRLYYVAAREGHLPAILSMIHVRRLTPSPALIFTAISSIILIIPGNFSSIINYSSFCTWTIYATTVSSLLYVKIKRPDIPRPYKVPIIVPILFLIISVYLVLAPVIDSPQIEFLYVFLFALSGIIVYIPFVHYKLHPEFLQKATLHLQLLLEVAPTERFQDDK
ncbi:b(0,+)-type amino acid transporter 1-like isoform X2 [Ambystoma mexicanum]|uniref:b(0,+)-type amino acid transporter 1-like isoform X2 n=1 Tax=Ambystoma mexicanum TaxID=8296 RepID=UPI0037E8BCFA